MTFVQGMAASNPESKAALDVWLKGDRLGIGWGSTSLAVDGGVRTTGFGPELLSGRFFTGMVAAIAIPNLLNATAASSCWPIPCLDRALRPHAQTATPRIRQAPSRAGPEESIRALVIRTSPKS